MKNNINSISKTRKSTFVGFLVILCFYACVPSKTLKLENSSVPENYNNLDTDTVNIATVKWKDFFSDPYLVSLIDTALEKNQELNILLQQVDMAKNEIKARKGEYLPFVNFYGGSEVEKVGKYTRNGSVEENLNIREDTKFPEPLKDYSLGLSASWELDIWKKLRNSKKSALYEYLSSMEGKNFMVTNLVAEISDAYYELISLDNQLKIVQENLDIQQNALRMVRLQKEAAMTTELAVRRFEAEVLKNQSLKYELQQQIVEGENKIKFLIGSHSKTIQRSSNDFVETRIDPIHTGIPSQLLQNRPDIRKAEFELEAAKLDIKVAKANFYPALGIKAGIGLQAFNTKYLTRTPESLAYSLVGDIVGPLINRNAIKTAYKNANDRQIQAVYEYEKSILNSYIEVSNLLSKVDNLQKSYDLKEGQVKALNESIDISILLFKSARADYMEVLLTQREALDAKMELVETKKEQMVARIHMYQALGGGWN